jgi:RNA polymerase sigma factor (sigma-70 family)
MSDAATAICRLLAPLTDSRTDGELLTAFRRTRDEPAFAELIRRHGPMVLAACRRLLPDPADAEDAFQTAFLVLVRDLGRLARQPSVGPWLHRVAVFTARNVRRRNARRIARQAPLPESAPDPAPGPASADLRLDLDAALLALPEKFRVPLVLCHLQGWSRRDAAERLGYPEGTLSSLLSRGLAKLRRRLPALDPAKGLSVPAAAVPAALATSTARAAVSAAVPRSVSRLIEGVIRMFWVKKATAATAALLVVFGLGVGVGVSVREAPRAGASADAGDPPNPDAAVAADDLDIQIDKAKDLLAQLELERKKLDADLRDLKLRATQVDAEALSLRDRIQRLEAERERRKATADPKTKPTGPALEVRVYAEKALWPCSVKEFDKDGSPIGTLICDNPEYLRVALGRVMLDPKGPRDLRIAIDDGAPAARIKAVLEACKAAGFKEAKVSGVIVSQEYRTVTYPVQRTETLMVPRRFDAKPTSIDDVLKKLPPSKP